MKLNRRSFIKLVSGTLAAAALRGKSVAQAVDEDAPLLQGDRAPARPLGIMPSDMRIRPDGSLYVSGEFTAIWNGEQFIMLNELESA